MLTMHINDLPSEILLKIFSYLPFETFIHVLVVCKRWKEVNNCHAAWKAIPVVYDGKMTDYKEFIDLVEEHSNKIAIVVYKRLEYDKITKSLPYLPCLYSIQMIMCCIGSQLASDLYKYSNLKKLSLRNSYVLTPKNLSIYEIDYSRFPRLEYLQLSDFCLYDNTFLSLLECKKLKHLFIEKVRHISQENVIKFVTKQKNELISLGIYGDRYTDEAVRHISECKKLTNLRIIRCDCLSDKSLTYLKAMNLTQIVLWNNTHFSTLALLSFFSHKNLRNLTNVSFSKIKNLTMDILHVIAMNCTNLKSIGIYRCPCMEGKIKSPDVLSLFHKQTVFFE